MLAVGEGGGGSVGWRRRVRRMRDGKETEESFLPSLHQPLRSRIKEASADMFHSLRHVPRLPRSNKFIEE